MSYRKNSIDKVSIFDSFNNLTSRNQRIVMNSWAKDFAENVFPYINEDRFSVLYSSGNNSRPNTPINFIVCALILKELNGLSDSDLFESICCDVRYQYALHSTSCEEQPVSDRTFSRFRERLNNYNTAHNTDLLKDEMNALNEHFRAFLNIHPALKRMDSFMISANIKNMTRLELIYTVVANCVKLLNKTDSTLVPDDMKHYLKDEDYNKVIYYAKDEDLNERLATSFSDALKLKTLMNEDRFIESDEYRLLIRLISEQSEPDEEGKPSLKDKKKIKPDSLQNPNDPDATYRKKYGDNIGYVGNVAEAVDEETKRSLICDADCQKNTYADTEFASDYIESKDNDDPETMITDAGFESEANRQKAREKNINLVSTDLKGKIPDQAVADFEVENGIVVKCPKGYAPIKSKAYKNGQIRSTFDRSKCENCPFKDKCKAKIHKKTAVVMLSKTTVSRARIARAMGTDEYRKLQKMRNAIEGIPSVFRRKFNVDRIPTRGLRATRMYFYFKVLAYNVGKLVKYSSEDRQDHCAQNSGELEIRAA